MHVLAYNWLIFIEFGNIPRERRKMISIYARTLKLVDLPLLFPAPKDIKTRKTRNKEIQ